MMVRVKDFLTSRDDNQALLGFVLVLFPLFVIYARYLYAPSDDAYIFLVYVRNLLDGHGLTYNGTLVEGYSSVFWVVVLSILGLTQAPLPFLAETLSLITGLFALLTTYFLAKSLQLEKYWVFIPSILLAATGDFAHYASVGLEQVLFTGFVAWVIALSVAKEPEQLLSSYYFPLLLALLILIRPEGALITAVLLTVLAFRDKSPLAIRCGFFILLMLLPSIVARWVYYGDWLPNTYYAKSNAGLANIGWGIDYLLGSWLRYGIIVVAAIPVIFRTLQTRRKPALNSRIWVLILISAAWLLNVVQFGGDGLRGGRMLLPALPLVYVVLAKLASQLDIKPKVAGFASILVCIGLILGYLSDSKVMRYRNLWLQTHGRLKDAGIHLRENFAPETVVALNPAGVLPFYSELPTIDMHGLNDPYIAHHGKRDRSFRIGHQAGDGAYVLSRRPDVILIGLLHKEPFLRVSPLSEREIWNSADFRENYELEKWPGIGFAYIRKSSESNKETGLLGLNKAGQ